MICWFNRKKSCFVVAAMAIHLANLISCITFALLALFGAQTQAGSNGAPLAACETMGDPHTVFPSKPIEESPFSIFLSKNQIKPGEIVGLTLALNTESNRLENYFKGYMVMAYNEETGNSTGTFTNVAGNKGQFLNCFGEEKSAVTHVNNNLKQEVRFDWRAPDDFIGKVVFKATFVENYWIFWASVPSGVLTVTTDQETTKPTDPTMKPTDPTTEHTTPSATTTKETTPQSTLSTTTTTPKPTTLSATGVSASFVSILVSLFAVKLWSNSN